LGLPAVEVDGGDVAEVWKAAHSAIERARRGKGPTFLHALCVHLEGHFLGFQLLRIVRDPSREMPEFVVPLTHSILRPGGAALGGRLGGLKKVVATVLSTVRDPRRDSANDPVWRARKTLLSDPVRLLKLEEQIEQEIGHVLMSAVTEVPS
jgi:hypothetical protein